MLAHGQYPSALVVTKLRKSVEKRREHAEASRHHLVMVAVLLLLFKGLQLLVAIVGADARLW